MFLLHVHNPGYFCIIFGSNRNSSLWLIHCPNKGMRNFDNNGKFLQAILLFKRHFDGFFFCLYTIHYLESGVGLVVRVAAWDPRGPEFEPRWPLNLHQGGLLSPSSFRGR